MSTNICYIDIIDKCNLRCPTCVRGVQLLKNSGSAMSLEMFKKIIRKANAEGFRRIGIFNWTEPFLFKQLPEYIAAVKELGLACEVSSNLSLKPSTFFDNIKRSLSAGIDKLTVSVSGYTQHIYEINHVGGNIAFVKENFERISELKRAGMITTLVELRLIRFDYNMAEEVLLRDYANTLGLSFEVIEGVGHPSHSVDNYGGEDVIVQRLQHYTPERKYEKAGEICSLIIDTLSIDSAGQAYLCCAYPNYPSLQIGSFLDISKEELLLKRYNHPICTSCEFPRRQATDEDRRSLIEALQTRLGQKKGGGLRWGK